MGFGERAGDLTGQPERLFQAQRAFGQPRRQCFAFHKLHHNHRLASEVIHAVYGADVGMIQS
jgi:hypothetical protein